MRLLTGLVCLLVGCAHAPINEPGPKVVRSLAPADEQAQVVRLIEESPASDGAFARYDAPSVRP